MKVNPVIPGHLVQYISRNMDMVALPFEVTDDKFFMLGNFIFHANASCFRCIELSLPNWVKCSLVPFLKQFLFVQVLEHMQMIGEL